MADNNNDIERVLQLSTHIMELRRRLQESEAELKALLAHTSQTPATERRSISENGNAAIAVHQLENQLEHALARGSIALRIEKLLAASPAQSFGAEDVARRLELPDAQLATVRSTLHRLGAEGRIRKTGPGQYAGVRQQNQAGA